MKSRGPGPAAIWRLEGDLWVAPGPSGLEFSARYVVAVRVEGWVEGLLLFRGDFAWGLTLGPMAGSLPAAAGLLAGVLRRCHGGRRNGGILLGR